MAALGRLSHICPSYVRYSSHLFPECLSARQLSSIKWHTKQFYSFSYFCGTDKHVQTLFIGPSSLFQAQALPGQAQGAVDLRPSLGLGRWGQQQIRSKHKGQSDDLDSDEDSADDDDGDDDEEFNAHFPDDSNFPANYKEVKKHLKSTRADAVLGGGLNISRKKIDDSFLASKILLNGEKLTKKSKQMNIGDSVDLISETTDDGLKVKRVRLVTVAENKSSKDRVLTYLRIWKSNVTLLGLPPKRR